MSESAVNNGDVGLDRQIFIHIDEITFEQLIQISNFKDKVEIIKSVNIFGISDEENEELAYKMVKIDREFREMLELDFDKKYQLITNSLTEVQQIEIAENMETFYAKTNADAILAKLNGTFTEDGLFELYINTNNDDKKLPPFENLFYIQDKTLDQKCADFSATLTKQKWMNFELLENHVATSTSNEIEKLSVKPDESKGT